MHRTPSAGVGGPWPEYVEDHTSGTSQSVVVDLSAAYYDGTNADWIDERPSTSNGLTPLRNLAYQSPLSSNTSFTDHWLDCA